MKGEASMSEGSATRASEPPTAIASGSVADNLDKERLAIERDRLRLERQKLAIEFRLKRKELTKPGSKAWKDLLANPVPLAIVGGFITLMTTIVTNSFTTSANTEVERLRAGFTRDAAKQTLQADLIKKFVESPKTETVRENLRFLVDAGLIPEYSEKIKEYLEENPESAPQVGTESSEAVAKPGVWRWPVKTSVVGRPDAAAAKQIALADLLKLKSPVPIPSSSSHQTTRVDFVDKQLDVREGDIVRTEGWLHLVFEELTGDYVLQISTTKEDQKECFRVKIPVPDPQFVSSSQLRPLFALARRHVADMLAAEPRTRGAMRLKEPMRVQIAGQLFINFSRGETSVFGRGGCKAPTIWEIHPAILVEAARN